MDQNIGKALDDKDKDTQGQGQGRQGQRWIRTLEKSLMTRTHEDRDRDHKDTGGSEHRKLITSLRLLCIDLPGHGLSSHIPPGQR